LILALFFPPVWIWGTGLFRPDFAASAEETENRYSQRYFSTGDSKATSTPGIRLGRW